MTTASETSSMTVHYATVVLLVDDQGVVAAAVRKALNEQGDIEFHYCADSRKALEAAIRIKPTVILQDLMMPEIDGLELLQLYRADPAMRDVPVIVLSSEEEPKVKARAFELGANDYLVKLPDRVEFLARIRSHSQAYLNRLQRDEAYRALSASLQLREDFAHMVIHDLGTPLGTVLMDAEDLLANSSDARQKPGLDRIRNSALRLREMAHDMLLLAKMEHGKLRLDSRRRDLIGTIGEAARNLEPYLQRRGLALREAHEAPSLEVFYDANLILRVLDNLLSNAIKFSPSGGAIDIRTRPIARGKNPGVCVEIENQGSEIPEEMRERIFEKFEVGPIRRDVPQVGLGLAFCRMALEAHGGKIDVMPGQKGRIVFWFEL